MVITHRVTSFKALHQSLTLVQGKAKTSIIRMKIRIITHKKIIYRTNIFSLLATKVLVIKVNFDY